MLVYINSRAKVLQGEVCHVKINSRSGFNNSREFKKPQRQRERHERFNKQNNSYARAL